MDPERRNLVAQWAFDCQRILGRFHLKLEDVQERWLREPHGAPDKPLSYVGPGLEKAFMMTAAVTALGTRIFGRWGEGRGFDKVGLNRIKKDADAASAYAMSEALWQLTRNLPENHALMVSLGEGLMPKVGETPEMGSNPLLGFGRIYARPQVATFLDSRVRLLINDPSYGWDAFWGELQQRGITVWGAAIDTLENTTRFATGEPSGPLTVIHLYDQPLRVTQPYEGYMGCLTVPKAMVEHAEEESLLLDYRTPRAAVVRVALSTYPDLEPANIHVWTLGGAPRAARIGSLWAQWTGAGAHLVEDGWPVHGGSAAFVDSGTYAPTFRVGPYRDESGAQHLFLIDGYAASAEAIQAASLDPVLGLRTSLCLFSSLFEVPWEHEREVMRLDPADPELGASLAALFERPVDAATAARYRAILLHAGEAGMPLGRRTLTVDDLFPTKRWGVLALSGYMLPDPYTGSPGIEELEPGLYRSTVRAASRDGILEVRLDLRLREALTQSRLVFSPLLDRFYAGEDYRVRPVTISDSGRIRNELQTLCSEAIEYLDGGRLRLHFDRVDDAVLPPDKKVLIAEVLAWYKSHHPYWFRWLELA